MNKISSFVHQNIINMQITVCQHMRHKIQLHVKTYYNAVTNSSFCSPCTARVFVWFTQQQVIATVIVTVIARIIQLRRQQNCY